MFYNKRIFERCFSYNNWETHHWFTITMKSILSENEFFELFSKYFYNLWD